MSRSPSRPGRMQRRRHAATVVLAALAFAPSLQAIESDDVLNRSKYRVPAPPWAAGDERGMGNQVGPGTWTRCAWHMTQPRAKSYELSYVRSNNMPKSPFSGPYAHKYKPTAGIPGSTHAFNGEVYGEGAEPAQQATQIDALGHFAVLGQPWDGKAPYSADSAKYYGGFTQKDVKPSDDSPLLRLGVEKIPPIVTSAIVLDAKAFVGKGKSLEAGQTVTALHIEGMLKAQGLAKRGIMPGDVVYIRTGWGERWKDPDTDKNYYFSGPGLSHDAAQYLSKKRIVAIGLDVPFIDTVPEGMLQGKAQPASAAGPTLPFGVHHHMLTEAGIYHIENAKLDEIANDRVWTSCTMVMPLLVQGGAGSAIRPVAIGVPARAR